MKYLSIPLFIIGLLCLLTFTLWGAQVSSDGQLHEPFALLPIGWACLLLATLNLIILRIRLRRQSRK